MSKQKTKTWPQYLADSAEYQNALGNWRRLDEAADEASRKARVARLQLDRLYRRLSNQWEES